MDQNLVTQNYLLGFTSDISGWTIVKFFFYSLALTAVSEVPSTWGVVFHGAQGVVVLLLFAVILLPYRPALVLLLLLAVAGRDIVSSFDLNHLDTVYSTASIWQLQFGPIRPSWIIFGCFFAKLVQAEALWITSPVRRAIRWFATVPFVTSLLYGGFFTEHAMTEVVTDLKFPLMLLASIILFQSAYRNDQRYFRLVLSAFVGALLARHLIDLIQFAANLGPAIAEGVSRGSTDSAKGAVVFLIFFGMTLILLHKRRLLGFAVVIPSTLLLFAYGTRLLWITFILGVVLLCLSLGLRRIVIIVSIAVAVSVGGVSALTMVQPKSAVVILARSKTMTEGRSLDRFSVPVEYNFISRIDPIRYGEFLNVLHSSGRRFAYLWGTGYGGYYEDYPIDFPRDLKSSFPQYSLDAGKFFKTHSFSTHIFLKHGLLGLFVISALWFIPGYALFKVLRKRGLFAINQQMTLHCTMFSMLAFLITAIMQLYWSGKGLFINGLIIASCIEFTRHYSGADYQPEQVIT